MSNSYDLDYFGWAQLQAQLLREGRVTEADLDHIAEEIEDMGNSRRQESRNRLALLLLHLLKWEYQPAHRGRSWRSTIVEQRERIAEHLDENPSLRPLLDDSILKGYRYALQCVERETGLARSVFPASCPYEAGQILGADFLPGEL